MSSGATVARGDAIALELSDDDGDGVISGPLVAQFTSSSSGRITVPRKTTYALSVQNVRSPRPCTSRRSARPVWGGGVGYNQCRSDS